MFGLVVAEHLGLELLPGAGQVGLQVLALLLPQVRLLLPPGQRRGQLLVLSLQLLGSSAPLQDLLLLGQPGSTGKIVLISEYELL